MARKRKANKNKNRKVRRKRSAVRGVVANATTSETQPQFPIEDAEEPESWYSSVWRDSRAGSRAGRGFHFQDAVGAWFASRLASGDLAIDSITPEGLDDLQLDALDPIHVEVKSRQGRLGRFPLRTAAQHIADAWIRHIDRFGSCRRLVVVLEQGIEGWEQHGENILTEIPIAHLANEVDGLDACLRARIGFHERPSTILDDLKTGATLLSCSWGSLDSQTERQVAQVAKLPPAALRMIRQTLRSIVADAVDANAEADFDDRVSLDRTSVVEKINSVAELIDLASIQHALTTGICSPFDTEPIAIGDAFYEGVSTQPGHVGADLVVPRPDLVSQVMTGLESSNAVLLIGPSGVGKSAVLWTLPSALPGVLWFRVHRLSDEDVSHVVRLLSAYGASSKAPVGLLVDAAGRDHLEGWSRLRRSVAAIPGVLLVGTARGEDLFTLGDLADCTIVRVSLDEEAAATIHAGLGRRGATTVPHWREAFEQSDGLTLEFTHMLTKGTRLNDVLTDQVADRIRGDRAVELRILALVATADSWSASIPIHALDVVADAGRIQIRAALERLVEEHLLVERDGMLVGIHPIRSRGIVDAIHEVPPPELKTTVLLVLSALRGPDLTRFVYEVLRDVPDLEEPVLQALSNLVRDDVELLVACLRGLELLDFYRRAAAWAEIAERLDVPHASRPLASYWAIADIELPDRYFPQLRTAVTEMATLPVQSATRDILLGAVGLNGFGSALAATTNVDSCKRLLRAISRTSIDSTPLLSTLREGSSLVSTLQNCCVQDFGNCVAAACDVSPDLAKAFVSAVGGTVGVLKRIRDGDHWIRKLEIAKVEGDLVGVARFLFVSESEQGDPRERAIEIGRKLVRTLPDLDRVDVNGILPGGRALEMDGIDFGSSGLLSKYDHHPGATSWNQQRARLAQTLFGASETERLAEAAKLFAQTAELLRDFGKMFVLADPGSDERRVLFERRDDLNAMGARLRPPFGAGPLADTDQSVINDPLSALITDVCGNVLRRLGDPKQSVALSAYINDTVLGTHLLAARDQPWKLIGLDGPPPALEELRAGLSEINAVLTELTRNPDSITGLVSEARSGRPQGALKRAADRSRLMTRRRVQERRREVESALRSTEFTVDVFWPVVDAIKGKPSNFAIAVDLDSLADWRTASDQIISKVGVLLAPGESPVLLPVLKGRSVVALAVQLTPKIRAVTDLGGFEDRLPQPLDQRLTNQVIAAHNALQVFSGLSILNQSGDPHDEVTRILEQIVKDYNGAVAVINAIGDDVWVTTVVALLGEIGEGIKGEWNGEIESGSYAARIVEGTLGDGSQEHETLKNALILSLQWDSDPASGIAWFESL